MKKLWIINTKSRQELEKVSHVYLEDQTWRYNNRVLGFDSSKEGKTLLVERYCEGVYASVESPINPFTSQSIIPEWACRKITKVDPEVDVRHFI